MPNNNINNKENEYLQGVIRQQEIKLGNYQSECEEMYDGIVNLEKCLADLQTEYDGNILKITKLE